ncbi:arginine-tRNA ligase, partial [Anncaliia algerae PRA109]
MLIDDITKELVLRIAEITGQPIEKILEALTFSIKADQSDYTLEVVKFSKNPTEEATRLSELILCIPLVEMCFTHGPVVFIVIKKYEYTRKFLMEAYESEYKFDLGKGDTVVIDYSSPNIAKIFHIGHLRTTIIGNFLKNIYTKFGFKTIGINYLGDWGKQFGLVCTGFKKFGCEETLKKDPLKHLFDIYVKISAEAKKDKQVDEEARIFFKEMEEKKEENLSLWRKFRELSIKKYEEIYKMLNVHFDVYSGESFYGEKGKEIIMENSHLITTDDDGSKIISLGENGNFLVLKNDGSSLYSTRDIAAAFDRKNLYNPKKILYVVANEQSSYFVQLKCALSKLGYDSDIITHVEY